MLSCISPDGLTILNELVHVGKDVGWDVGWDAGWDAGWDVGWDVGWDAGWDAGWDIGLYVPVGHPIYALVLYVTLQMLSIYAYCSK